MIYEQVLKEKEHLERTIARLQRNLSRMPEGSLVCMHYGHLCKWYKSGANGRKYLRKSERPLAEQLAFKKYCSCRLAESVNELQAVNAFLNEYDPRLQHSAQTLLERPGYQDLLSSSLKPISKDLLEWSSASYEKNPAKPEKLIVPTIAGHMVRSKSEAMIVHCLYMNKIPYRYEAALQLGNQTIYPDFTIRHPRTGNYYYWEHFGLMDDPGYCWKTGQKIYLYSVNGITPSIELITTFEKEAAPLSTNSIEEIIETYFL